MNPEDEPIPGDEAILPDPAAVLSDWAWAEWVEEQGVGE